jgi:hypothetical protein
MSAVNNDNKTNGKVHFTVLPSVLSIGRYDSTHVGITWCFNLVILNFLIWQFTLTRQIDKFKLLSSIYDKPKNIQVSQSCEKAP